MTYTTRIAEAKTEAFEDGFSAGEEHGIAIGEKRGEERGRNEGILLGRNEGISLGITQTKLETAKNALSMNLTLEQVVTLTGLSIETIRDLADK